MDREWHGVFGPWGRPTAIISVTEKKALREVRRRNRAYASKEAWK